MKQIQIWANGVYFVLCFGLLIYFLPSITVNEDGLFSAEFTSINRSYELGKSERKTVVCNLALQLIISFNLAVYFL